MTSIKKSKTLVIPFQVGCLLPHLRLLGSKTETLLFLNRRMNVSCHIIKGTFLGGKCVCVCVLSVSVCVCSGILKSLPNKAIKSILFKICVQNFISYFLSYFLLARFSEGGLF